jgi:hypothetical protein
MHQAVFVVEFNKAIVLSLHQAAAKHAAASNSPFHCKVDGFNFFETLW